MGEAQQYLGHIAKEQEAFRRVLRIYFPDRQYTDPRVLDICSGVANEEPLLREHFGEGTEVISIDRDASLEPLLRELGRTSVVFGCVEQLDRYVAGKFHLIMGRNVPLNPNHNALRGDEVPDYWPGVFKELTGFMGFYSTLFLTLAREDEFDRAKEILQKIRYKIHVEESNPVVVPSDRIGIRGAETKDHYVIVAQPPFSLSVS